MNPISAVYAKMGTRFDVDQQIATSPEQAKKFNLYSAIANTVGLFAPVAQAFIGGGRAVYGLIKGDTAVAKHGAKLAAQGIGWTVADAATGGLTALARYGVALYIIGSDVKNSR